MRSCVEYIGNHSRVYIQIVYGKLSDV